MDIIGHKIEHKNLMWLIHRGTDGLALVFGYLLAAQIVGASFLTDTNIQFLVLLVLFISLLVYPIIGVYRPWRGEQRRKEILTTSAAWLFAISFSAVVLSYLGKFDELNSNLTLLWSLLGLLLTICFRLVAREVLLRLRESGHNLRHIVIIGDGDHASEVIKTITKSKWTGYNILGYFSDSKLNSDSKHFGALARLSDLIQNDDIECDQVWIVLPLSEAEKVNHIVEQMKLATFDIRYLPDLSSFDLINHSVSSVAGMPTVNISITPMVGINRLVKSFEDKVISLIILLLISPLMLLIALAVKLTSPGPVFYKQERVGWNNRPFNMLKFRSMSIDAEQNGVQWGGADSMQVTRVGKFIRATSLDELPQFLNVLLGDMSIVGPRPERTVFVEKFKHEIPGYMRKHMVKAGITGLAQIGGWRGDTDLNKRVECDLEYIKTWSLWLDLKIIFLTFFKGFIHKNAS